MTARRLRVDWPACKANGICAEVVPELITRDEWGYPVVSVKPVPVAQESGVERAVSACPMHALRLLDVPSPPVSRRERRRVEQ